MKSLPTVADYHEMKESNEQQFMQFLCAVDPKLADIKHHLNTTGVNPDILIDVIRCLNNLYLGSKYGKVVIYMSDGVITAINPEETNMRRHDVVINLQIR